MNSKQFLKEGFLEDAQEAHSDHEVQMARVDCYYAAEHAIVLHKLLRNISEEQGLEGWVASKITLANDYLKSVREHLEYQMMNVDAGEDDFLPLAEGLKPVKKNSVVESTAPVAEDEEEKFQDFERGPWYVILKGKAVTVNGMPKKFNWLNGAKTYFRSMMDKNPEMAQKIKREYDEASDKKSVIYYTKNLPADNTTSTEQPVSESEKPGLWANIRAKRERIKGGSGERMRKPGSKGAPSDADIKSIRAASESTENASNTWYDNLTGKYPKTKLALDLLPPTAMATSAVDAVNNLSKGNYGAAALDAAGLIPGVKPLSKFLPRSISIDNISSGRKVAKGASTAKDVGDYIDSEFPNEVKESDFHSQFAAMIDDMKKSGQLKTGGSSTSQAKYASEPSREELTARLRELESEFDPEYQYSDDYSFWTKQNAIAREIASIKKKLGSQGVAEGSGAPEITPGMKTQYGTVVSVNGNTVTVKASNGELTTVNIHDIQQGVAEGFSDVVKGIKRSIKGKEHPDVVASKHAGRAIGHYNQGDIAAGDKETNRYKKIRNMHLKAKGVAEGYKNTYNVGDRVDSPLGTGTIVAVSKNVNVDGRVRVKLDDPSKAGEDGKYQDSFVLNTTQLKHIDEQGVMEGSDSHKQSHLDAFKSETDTMKPGTKKYVGRKDGKEVYAKKDAQGNVKFYHRDGIKGPLKGVAEGSDQNQLDKIVSNTDTVLQSSGMKRQGFDVVPDATQTGVRGSITPSALNMVKSNLARAKNISTTAGVKPIPDPVPLKQPWQVTDKDFGVNESKVDEACWKGYRKEGMKTMFGKKYPNCVKNTKSVKEVTDKKISETTAGSIAGVVNPKIKNKSKVGTLFGGTYKQQKDK